MTPRKQLAYLVFLGLLCSGATCGDAGDAPSNTEDGGQAPDAGGARCEGVPDFRIGLRALGKEGIVRGEIVEADAVHKYENDWVVKLTDPDGKPLADLDLYEVQPFMPAHGHDGTFPPQIRKTKAAGTYSVTRINLWMQDHWEVRFFVHAGSQDDEVIFHVCVPS